MAAGHLDQAVREFQTILTLAPGNVDARANLAAIAFLKGDCGTAARMFGEVVKEQPSLVKAQAILGLAQSCLGQNREAAKWLSESFPRLPKSKLRTQVGMALVEIRYRSSAPGEAVDTLRELQRDDPANPDVLYAAARIYMDLANGARDALAAAAPDSARLRQLMAQHLVNSGDVAGALAQYRRALAIDPKTRGVHYELGETILQQSTSREALTAAEKEFREALAENPGNGNAEYKLGRIEALRGDYKSALPHYLRALTLQPDHANAHVGAAAALRALDDPKSAEEQLLQAIRLEPGNANAHFRLAALYRDSGREAAADVEIKKFRSLQETKERIQQVYSEVHQAFRDKDEIPPEN